MKPLWVEKDQAVCDEWAEKKRTLWEDEESKTRKKVRGGERRVEG